MKVLSGCHLTATNKKHIKAILEAGLLNAKVNTITYSIKPEGDFYSVTFQKMDRGLIDCSGTPLRLSTYSATFTL